MNALVAGLYGKLPAHGDFVRRGWSEATAAALDRWLGDGAAALRKALGEDGYAERMREAPLWHGFVPAGMAGEDAIQLVLTPSVDRSGRLFFLAAGVVGSDAAVWTHLEATPRFAGALDVLAYRALAGEVDADGLADGVAGATEVVGEVARSPGRTCWWPAPPSAGEAPAIDADRLDRPLLHTLLGGGPR